MLLPDFYTILHTTVNDENKYTVEVRLNEYHAVYDGHFPGNPVTPGVCTLQMVKECIETITETRLQTRKIASCKYTGMIIPERNKTLYINIALAEAEENGIQCNAQVTDGKDIFMKLKSIYNRL